ncbi:hypothetical protein [Taklimakanibacter deserti]|uniref:hypothetical protein n=1 Tax=Taklimakanibacter deserti TaxID=2267839 RepID=UPI0034D6E53A
MTTTRRTFVAGSVMAALPLSLAAALAEDAKQADFLFVQTAKGMTFDKAASKLTLEGVSPVTVMFTDRPERIASHMRTAAFVPFWSQGKDSFLSDPPNADISILEGDKLQQIVVTLMDPVLDGDRLSYGVKVLEGEMPAKAADVSVFIDVIGMPLTPLSYAGVARRTWRRAVLY